MFDTVKGWWEHHSEEKREKIRGMLTKEVTSMGAGLVGVMLFFALWM